MLFKKKGVRSPTGDIAFLQNICPIKVHQAMTKEQKVTILFKKKKSLGQAKPLKIQASPNHLLGLFPMGCNQDKHHCFHGTVGRGGNAGEDAGATRGGRPPKVQAHQRIVPTNPNVFGPHVPCVSSRH